VCTKLGKMTHMLYKLMCWLSFRLLQISEDPVDSIDGLFMALRGDGNVKRIEISSTLGRRYHDSSLEETTTSLDNANGRALVVCNLQGREGGEAELDYAKLSLGLQLGLQVPV